jgi:hypothetical protein
MKISKTVVAVALSAASMGALADITVLGTSFAAGATTQSTLLGTFSAFRNLSTSTFEFKPAQDGIQGVGIKGGVQGEIDTSERLVGIFNQAYGIGQFTLAMLFNSGQYGDVNEIAEVSVDYADDNSAQIFKYKLTSTGVTTATWNGPGSVQNVSKALVGYGGAWSVLNPFGAHKISSISFTALPGTCVVSSCTSQSEFSLVSVTAVPEVETYAMMLAGLGLMGTIARRRNKAKTA